MVEVVPEAVVKSLGEAVAEAVVVVICNSHTGGGGGKIWLNRMQLFFLKLIDLFLM